MAQPAEGLQDLSVAVHGVGREAMATAIQHELLEVGPPELRGGHDLSSRAPLGEPAGPVRVPLQGSSAEVAGLAVRQELLAEGFHRDPPPGQRSSNGSDHAVPPLIPGGRRLKTCPVF